MSYKANDPGITTGSAAKHVANLAHDFMVRRNFRTLRPGDRVIVQTQSSGQTEAMVMGRSETGEVLVRLSRWSAVFAVDAECILRRLAVAA